VQEIADTGAGTGVFLLLGLVMAGLVVGFRLLRVRSLAG
jgi:LPXTG-motif cell wall-anchored protein